MPELPEVETVCRGLAKTVMGKTIAHVHVAREKLRVPLPKNFGKKLEGRTIIRISRRAKYILMHLDSEQVVIAHLGMSGSMVVHKKPVRDFDKHDHVIMHFGDGSQLIFNDPRRFGLMELCAEKELSEHIFFSHLGPEPFGKTFSADYLKTQLTKRSSAIKVALMDQQLVVGVGNIYASEALYEARILPTRKASSVAGKAAILIKAIQKVLNAAIASGGSTLRDYVRANSKAGYFQHYFKVYDREGKPCPRCKTPIKRIVQAGRSTYYCPHCQK